ncbi:DUF6318 family protein [Ruania rhizosphaerae]|uniref:DUF6318 family protein n=1 Tax=Ruania rhizosphaerae TaxID=1840413 RepID=UPI0013597D49|nr:DUF6318 family protein [Ruania rhizosphaerae]
MPIDAARCRALGVLIVALLTLTACSNEPDVAPTTRGADAGAIDHAADEGSQSANAPDAEIPIIEEPQPPEAMSQESLDGAEAAAHYVAGLMLYAWAGGGMAELDRWCTPTCEFCDTLRETVASLEADGSMVVSDWFETTARSGSVEYDPSTGEVRYIVILDVLVGPSTVFDVTGPVRTDPEYAMGFGLALEWTAQGWRLHEAGQV